MIPTLELRDVSMGFGSGRVQVDALLGVSLVAEAGELVAVMGPSGSGKTTLLSIAGGLDRPTAGAACIEGVDMRNLSAARLAELRRRRIGYVFQQFNLIDGLTAAENVSLPLELDGVKRSKARSAAIDTLERVGMADLADRFPQELSGGEQQRVAIARGVVGDRILLLADEPTGALDSMTGEAVLRLLRTHCDRGGSGLLVTHDARFAAWADRVVFLRDGKLVDESIGPQGPESLLPEHASS